MQKSAENVILSPKIWLKIALNAVRLPKFEPVIVVDEKDHGKRFTATFRAGGDDLRKIFRGCQWMANLLKISTN